jgi:hypothetical protein
MGRVGEYAFFGLVEWVDRAAVRGRAEVDGVGCGDRRSDSRECGLPVRIRASVGASRTGERGSNLRDSVRGVDGESEPPAARDGLSRRRGFVSGQAGLGEGITGPGGQWKKSCWRLSLWRRATNNGRDHRG